MGLLDEMFGLAPQEAGAQVGQQAAAPAGGLDPVTRAALLSAGLQLMTGGWGNGTQQLAAGIGAGAQGAAGTQKLMDDRAMVDRERQDKMDAAASSQANQREIAHIGADSREAVAREKIAGAIERARLIRGPQSNQEMKIYADQFKSQLTNLQKEAGNPVSPYYKMSSENLKHMAESLAKDALEGARNATGQRSQGTPLPDDGAGGDRGGAPASTTTPGGQTGNATSTPTTNLQQMLKDPKYGPTLQQKIQTPEGRAEISKANPALAKQVQDWYLRNQQEYFDFGR